MYLSRRCHRVPNPELNPVIAQIECELSVFNGEIEPP